VTSEVESHFAMLDREPSCPLTPAELRVLRLYADGRRAARAAEELWVTTDTVRWHTARVLKKLRVPNTTAAVAYAIRRGWL
jgi:DNA-binding CsgD family transcriptional regulator